jgi:4-amino-4-deoxy-L-arabinose transferase-like glycosyltransferase
VLLLALLVRTAALDRDELWFDEAYAALVAQQPVGGILEELRADSSPPLYYFVLRAWMRVGGDDPRILRALSAAAGVLAVLLCGVLGARMGGSRLGGTAMLLLALSPLHVYYSREVRPYSLLVALALVAFLSLEALVRRRRTRDAAGFGLAVLAAGYTHTYGLLLVVPLVAAVVARLASARHALLALGILAAGYAPWIPVLIGQVRAGAASWIGRWWHEAPAGALLGTFAAFTPGGTTPPYIALGGQRLPSFVPLAAYVVFGLTVGRALVPAPAVTARRAAIAAMLVLAVPFAVSFVSPVYLVGRYDVIVLPLFVLVCAEGLDRMRRPTRVLGLAAMLALATLALGAYFQRPPVRALAARAAFLAHAADPGDVVICTGFTRNTLEYYVRRAGGRQPFFSFPRSFDEHRGWLDERVLGDAERLGSDARALVEDVGAAVAGRGRLWVAHSRELPAADAALMRAIETALAQRACPSKGEERGFTCWQPRERLSRGGPADP